MEVMDLKGDPWGIKSDCGFNICQKRLLGKLMQLEAKNPVSSSTAESAKRERRVFRLKQREFCGSQEDRTGPPRDQTAAPKWTNFPIELC